MATGATGAEIPDISSLPEGATAVVDDRFGGYEALGLAEWLATQGLAVTLTTPTRRVAANALLDLVVQPALERLQALNVQIQTKVDSPPPANLTLTVAKHPHDPLSTALTKAGLQVKVIGDAQTPATILTAIAAAHSINFSD